MDLLATISARRSIKKYDPAHRMSENEIEQLFDAVLMSPTSFNIQNWRFVAVTDKAVQQAVQAKGYNQAQFGDCSLLVLICGDRMAYGKDPGRYWASASEEARAAIVPMITGIYQDRAELQRDENLRSGSMAGMTLMLAAKAMGYDTCPMIGFDFAAVAEIIDLPVDHDIVMAVTVGKALEPARERGGQLPAAEVVFRDRFPGD